MERYVEKKRERRRRDLERIVERMAARIRRWWDRPGCFHCRGERIETWEDFHRASRSEARRTAGNLTRTRGRRYGGRNPRRLTGDLKMSDLRAAHAAAEQLIEAAWSDGSPPAQNAVAGARPPVVCSPPWQPGDTKPAARGANPS